MLKYLKKFSLHFLALCIAFFIWIYVLSSAETVSRVRVKLHYVVPVGYSIVNSVDDHIVVTIEGPKALVRSFEESAGNLKVNLAGQFRKSVKNYEFSTQNLGFSTPFGIKVKSISPDLLSVELEESLKKSIPVELQTIGGVPIDHKLIGSSLSPKAIEIVGPKSLIDKINSIKTQVVDLSLMTKSGEKELTLSNNNDRIKMSPKFVRYSYEVKTTRSNMILKGLPIYFLGRKNVKSAQSRVANLMVLAENANKLNLELDKIKIIAEIDESKGLKQKIKLRAVLPQRVHLLKIIPDEIEIELVK